MDKSPRIVVVGCCASGKSTLVKNLRKADIPAFSVAQEHSSVSYMFRLRDPDFVVFLDASYEELRRRRDISWGKDRLQDQKRRLAKAKHVADIHINTDQMTPGQVSDLVLKLLEENES